jgi:hypothetical protein
MFLNLSYINSWPIGTDFSIYMLHFFVWVLFWKEGYEFKAGQSTLTSKMM